jgi:SET domain-containing protein
MRNKIEIKKSKIRNAGRGVFAAVDIKKGELIEICPIIILWGKDFQHVQETMLIGYVYRYTGESTMIALGYGSLYNHLNIPNAKYELVEHEGMKEQDSELYITALNPILKNEEIYINYGGEYNEKYSDREKR